MNDNIAGKTVAILGLAFKANTDDVRYSPAIPTIEKLREYGVHIKAYDPEAMSNMCQLFPDITYCTSSYETVADADAIIIMTEWNEFKYLDLARVANLVKQRILVDARNLLNATELKANGFVFDNIGRPHVR